MPGIFIEGVHQALGFPQKLVPAAFALYWLGKSEGFTSPPPIDLIKVSFKVWNELNETIWGRVWLGWSVTAFTLLLGFQLYSCDMAFPIAAQYPFHSPQIYSEAEMSHTVFA